MGHHGELARRRPPRPQLLAERVAGGERPLGEGDDLGRGAVVRLEREDARAGDGGEPGHHLGVGAAPRVDGLVGVGDGDEVPRLPGDELHEAALHRVDVVELVDQHPAVALLEARAHAGVLLEQPHRQGEEVGVVDRPHRALALLVALGDGAELGHPVAEPRVGLEHDRLDVAAALGGEARVADDRRRLRQRRAGLAAGEDGVAGHGAHLRLVLRVEHGERRRQPHQRPVPRQDPAAHGVERARR